MTPDRFAEEVMRVTDGIAVMLIAKNAAYGDAALTPLRVFSRASPVEQILVRLDDKLSRLARGSAAGEDVELDLLGYLVLLRIARGLEERERRREQEVQEFAEAALQHMRNGQEDGER